MKGGLLITESQGKEYVKNNIDIFNSYNNQIFYILEYLLNIWKQQPKTLATLYIIKNIETKLKRINNNIYQEPRHYYQDPGYYYQDPRYYYQEPRHYYQDPQYYYQDPHHYYQEPQYYYQDPQYYYQEPIFKIKSIHKNPSPKNPSPKKLSPKKNIAKVLEIKPRYDISPMHYRSASISV